MGSPNKKWENNTQDCSIPDDNLVETLSEDENDRLDMNGKD